MPVLDSLNSRLLVGSLALAATLVACDRSPSSAAPSASASAAAAAAPAAPGASASSDATASAGGPLDPAAVAKVVNRDGDPPYAGPVGTLRGVVRMEGDASPDSDLRIPVGCGEGAATYGKLFRVGQDKTLADAMVAVTGYRGFVPAHEDAKKVTLQGCAFNKRTVVATFGQRIEVANLDKTRSYMPYLDGGVYSAVMVAVPSGDPVRLYAQQPGRYMLRDMLPKKFLVADVFVVPYPTHDVTGLDGRYEIANIPVGKVKVNAYLPVLNKTIERDVEIKEGVNELDLSLTFDAKKDMQPEALPKPKLPATTIR
jgi:hypothetical protein